ncbi:MAG TPA: rhodanese-like domain-containing protein [Candidatus Limnocylindrales bacterium]|nr:rhodanese-like domain-containing protein [Candidatus Limnocylindrales bacterium]
MRLRQFVIDGLGHLSTLLIDDDAGAAAVVDPRRDVDVYLAAAAQDRVRITHVVETHLHNDYVSGARELAALTGATHVIGAGAALAYEHRGVRHGDGFDVGALAFRALETPGHTPEHVAYSVADTTRASEPVLLLTGGSLLVGAVGRTDLLGAENAVRYAHDLFRSLHDVVMPHADFVAVHPTHGAGSLCSTGIASTPSSTIGFERRHNPMLEPSEPDAFARALLPGQPAFPRYFARMRPTNQAGPTPLGRVPGARPLPLPEVLAALARGAIVVDARQPAAHAVSHVPGSVSIPAGSSFGTWLGWIVEPDRPVVLVLDRPDDWDDLVRQSLRIGHESVVGYLHGGLATWAEAGQPVESSGRLSVTELAARISNRGPETPIVVDVRQATEYRDGHVEGAVHLFAGSLQDRLDELPRDRPIVTMCASGFRSSIAASLLRAAGFTDVSWVADGVPAWTALGLPVERGGSPPDEARSHAAASHGH